MMVRLERLAPETAQRLMGWQPTGFSVWVGDPIEPDETMSRQRLARYITKAPVALERMEYDKENCQVHYRSFAQGLLPMMPPATHEPRDPRIDDEWPTDPPFQDD